MSDKEHARFSPSSAHRRIACPGSLALEERMPHKTSDYAEEGTAAHELMEWVFRDNAPFADIYIGKKTKNGYEINRDMAAAVQTFADTIRATAAGYERLGATVTIFCEERVTFADEMGDAPKSGDFFGTADIVIIAEFDDGKALISIDDFKYGKGIKVYAEENEQILTYGLAVVSCYSLIYNIKRVRMAIHQPRLDHMDEWEVPVRHIYKFRDQLRPAARLALEIADMLKAKKTTIKKLDKAGHLVPSDDACFFCKAKAHCPARARVALKAVDDMFEDLNEMPDVKKVIAEMDDGLVTLKQIENFGLHLDVLEDFIKAVRGRIQAELYDGKKLKHFKLVQGRKGHRAWESAKEAEKLFKKFRLKEEDLFTRELISPPAAEKLFGNQVKRWNQLKEIIVQPPGRPAVALITDKRPPVQPPNVNDMFDDLEDGNFDDLA